MFLQRTVIVAVGAGLAGCSSGSSRSPLQKPSYSFTDTFDRPDGPVGNGWIDAHDVTPLRQDPVGIANKSLTLRSLQGPRDQDPDYSGWRGAIYRQTGLETGLSVKTLYAPATLDATGGPLVHCVPRSKEFGIGCWYDHALSAWELGLVGGTPSDYRYLDFNFAEPPNASVEMELRSIGDEVAFYVDGDLKGGPVSVPAALRGSSLHGAQLDFLTDKPGSPTLADCSIVPWRGVLDTYAAASVTSGAVVAESGARSVELQFPEGRPGDVLVAIVASSAAGMWTARGWNQVVTGEVDGALLLRALSIIANDGAGRTVSFATSEHPGNVVGVGLRVSGQSVAAPFYAALRVTKQPSTMVTAPSATLGGLHRLSIWIGASAQGVVVAPPEGFGTLAAAPRTGGYPSLVVATRAWDGTRVGTPPFGYSGASMGEQRGTLSGPRPSVGALVTINPRVHGV